MGLFAFIPFFTNGNRRFLVVGKLKKGLREILRGSLSQWEAALKYEIGCQTFKQYLQYFTLENASEVRQIEKINPGAPPYLNVKSLTILTLFGFALDSMDYQLTFENWRGKFHEMKKSECEGNATSLPVEAPSDMTVRKIINQLKLPWKLIQEGPSVDALWESKASEKYLCDYFNMLELLLLHEKATPERIWNCDEVGVQLSDMSLHVYSTKKTVRRNLCNEHLTAHLTVSATGDVLPLYLIFPGEGIADISESISAVSDIWSNWSTTGWMDGEHFQAFILLYIQKISEIQSKNGSTETHILLLDGHSSCYNLNTLWTAALNWIMSSLAHHN